MGTRRPGVNGRAQHTGPDGEQSAGQDGEQTPGHGSGQGSGQGNGQSGGRVVAWELAAEAAEASRARDLTRQTLGGWRVGDPGDVDDIVLMVDELITNAIVHGSGPVRLRLRLEGPAVIGEVTDDSPAGPRPSGVDPGGLDWSEAGRGLMLVGALASEFGARPAGHGKTVWFTRLLHIPNGQTGQQVEYGAQGRPGGPGD